ncbi:unnamed protein product [Lota lota]
MQMPAQNTHAVDEGGYEYLIRGAVILRWAPHSPSETAGRATGCREGGEREGGKREGGEREGGDGNSRSEISANSLADAKCNSSLRAPRSPLAPAAVALLSLLPSPLNCSAPLRVPCSPPSHALAPHVLPAPLLRSPSGQYPPAQRSPRLATRI